MDDDEVLFLAGMLAAVMTVIASSRIVGYWHQRADERHGNPPKVTRSY